MPLDRQNVPVAYSMMELVERLPQQPDSPFDAYCCCWMAFNNIYAKLAEQGPHAPRLVNGFRRIAGVEIPKVHPGKEKGQISKAVRTLSPNIKHRLITADQTRFFVMRVPRLRGVPKPQDARLQVINGVLNVGHTVATGREIWSPIDRGMFERYLARPNGRAIRNELARQIVLLLYTVRNNTFHGGKMPDDANDREVIENALPLLKTIVLGFLRPQPW